MNRASNMGNVQRMIWKDLCRTSLRRAKFRMNQLTLKGIILTKAIRIVYMKGKKRSAEIWLEKFDAKKNYRDFINLLNRI